jgi:hypothetical protein
MSKNWIAETADIMERFEWDRVQKAMEALDLHWAHSNYSIPSVEEMKSTALQLIVSAVELFEKDGETAYCATGGFVARIHAFKNAEPQLTLHFEVTETRGIA